MKQLLPVIFAFLLTTIICAPKVVETPQIGMSTISGLEIEKIEFEDTVTILSFHLKHTPGNWINIPTTTYILPVGTEDTLYILSAKGIPLAKRYSIPISGEINYKLTFPKVNQSVKSIDYGESGDHSSWFICDIQLKPELNKSKVPGLFGKIW